jgi:hypothetical protein
VFPTCSKDLIRGEPNASFAMLTAWFYSPEFVPMQNASHLVSRIIETFQSSILIGLLSSPALMDWVLFTGELAYRRSSRGSPFAVEVNIQATKHTVSLVKDSGNLLEAIGDILFDEEILLWVTSNHRRTPNIFTRVCDLATTASHIAVVRAQEHGYKISDELDDDVHDGVKGWTSFAARLIHYHPESIPEHMTNSMRKDLTELEDENIDPESMAYATAPHRKLCEAVSTVINFVKSGNSARGLEGRVILSPSIEGAAIQACEQFAALRKAKMIHLGEDFIH